MSTRSLRKERIGIVSSDKMDKSVIVSEVKKVKHPVYGKFVLKNKKYVAHDEKNDCNEGDTVKSGQVICIIESMKIMNEIESEFDGKIKVF